MRLHFVNISPKYMEIFHETNRKHNLIYIPILITYMFIYILCTLKQYEAMYTAYMLFFAISATILYIVYTLNSTRIKLCEICTILIIMLFIIYNGVIYSKSINHHLFFYLACILSIFFPLSMKYENILYLLGNLIAYILSHTNEQDIKMGIAITLLSIVLYVYKEATRRIDFNRNMKCDEENKELIRLNEELSKLSEADSLTSLLNRRAFEKYMEISYEHYKRNGLPFTIFMIDIDYFKQYNDAFGHLEGDECLKVVAEVIKRTFKRSSDIVARYGGEEFVVATSKIDTESILELCRELCQNMEAQKLKSGLSLTSQYMTVSIGVASRIPDPKIKAIDIIRLADNALYKAKNQGRNCYILDVYKNDVQ